MKAQMTIDRLSEIVSYLAERPQVVCDPYPRYDSRIYELLNALGMDEDYGDNHQITEEKPIAEMDLKDIQTMFTFILRGERFCDGCIAGYINDGTLLKLAEREMALLRL